MGESALRGRSRTARVPEWLEKWAALIMEYVETEQALLPRELLALRPPYATYTPASAAAEAKGVSDNRLQNVVITLDKVKLCLERPGTSATAPALLACLCPQPYLHMLCTHVGSASFPKQAQLCVWHTVASSPPAVKASYAMRRCILLAPHVSCSKDLLQWQVQSGCA